MRREESLCLKIQTEHTRSRTVVTLKNGIPLSIGSVKLTEREHITQIGKESLDKKICLNISESMVKVG